jgi:predicted metalloprotease
VVRYLGLGDAAARPGSDTTGPNWSDGFSDQTVRQVVRVSADGSQVRVRLPKLYDIKPLQVTGATIARTRDGAVADPGTMWSLTFHGARSATIQTGQVAASDPAARTSCGSSSSTSGPSYHGLVTCGPRRAR